MEQKKWLMGLVLSALAMPIFAVANENVTMLDPVFVEGHRDVRAGGYVYTNSRVGVLGTADTMQVPFTQVSMTEQAVQDFATPALPLQQVLVNEPSVRASSSSPMYSDFSLRGVNMNGTHMYFNGVPSLFSQFRTAPNHWIGRLDLSVGAATVLNGTAASSNGTNSGRSAAPGMMNVVSKRAEDMPVRTLTLAYTSKKNVGTFVDVGQRLGESKDWGVRVYGGWLQGGLALPLSGKAEKTIGVNVDHQGQHNRTNLFVGHIDLRVDGSQRWFTYDGKQMPKAPNHKNAYDFPEETKWAHWWVTTLNHEQDLNENWTAFFNYGQAVWSGSKYNNNANLKFDDAGAFVESNKSNLMNEKADNRYYQLGVKGHFHTGDVLHEVAIAYDRSRMSYWKQNYGGPKGMIGGNLYDGIRFAEGYYPLPVGNARPWSYTEKNSSWTINDRMSLGKWTALVAFNRRDGKMDSTSEHIQNKDTLPAYGLVYRPNDKVAVYASYAENISRGRQVPDDKNDYANKGEILPPVKQKIKEAGVKYNAGDWLLTLARFSTTDGNNIDLVKDGKKYLVTDGENEFKGWELSFNGKVSEKLTLTGGFLAMDASRKHTTGGKKDGWYVVGVSDFSAVLAAKYALRSNLDLLGRMQYSSKAKINDNGGTLPAFTTWDLGLNWRTQMGEHPVNIHAMVYNVFDKSYWHGRGGSTTFGLSWPRTFVVSAEYKF